MMRGFLLLLLALASLAPAYDIGYNLGLEQVKETSRLLNSFSFSEAISSTVSMSLDASFTADRSYQLERFIDGRTGNAALRWNPQDRIELSSAISRSISLQERYGETIEDQVDNTATGQVRYVPADWASVLIGLGFHFKDSELISGDSTLDTHDEGGVRNFSVSVQKPLFDRLSTSFTMTEGRVMGEQLDTGSDDLAARFGYAFPGAFEGGSLSVQLAAARIFSTYTDSSYSIRQQDWSHATTLTLPKFADAVDLELGTDWSWTNRYWEYEDSTSREDPRDRLERTRSIDAHVRWQMMDALSSDIVFSRTFDRSDRKRTGFPDNELYDIYEVWDTRVLNATVTYLPGDSRIVFLRSIQLARFDTEGSWPGFGDTLQDNSDKDELREVLSLSAEVPVSQRMTLLGRVQGQNLETVFLESEYSANSRNSSTYSFSPGVEYDLGLGWEISETIDVSADYTTYRFPESSTGNDLLFRRLESRLSIQRVQSDSTMLGISHNLRLQDQGSYENSLFSRSEESINSTVTLNSGFRLGSGIGITPSYSYEFSRRKFLGTSFLEPQEDNLHHLGLRTRMSLGEGILSLNLKRTFYSDERDSYWNASVGFNYLF